LSSIVNPVALGSVPLFLEKAQQEIDALIAAEHYDSIVCDFLFSAPNLETWDSVCFFSTMSRQRSGKGTPSIAVLS
jgi:hypothetical protein